MRLAMTIPIPVMVHAFVNTVSNRFDTPDTPLHFNRFADDDSRILDLTASAAYPRNRTDTSGPPCGIGLAASASPRAGTGARRDSINASFPDRGLH